VFGAHVDVVPGDDGQFRPYRADGRLYGRGTHDMKVAALVMAGVFRDLAPTLPYPLALQLVTDEEIGGYDGSRHQLDQGLTAEFAVIGEQSALRVVTESKGILRVRLEATGRAAHAAYPWLGRNAALLLVDAVAAIREAVPVPPAEAWATTATVSQLRTGPGATNQVPASASATLDIRFLAEDTRFTGPPDRVEAYLTGLCPPGVTAMVLTSEPPHHVDPERPEVMALRAAARAGGYDGSLLRKHGAADSRHFAAHGIDAVIFGPGGDGQHGPEEYVTLDSIPAYDAALRRFLLGVENGS